MNIVSVDDINSFGWALGKLSGLRNLIQSLHEQPANSCIYLKWLLNSWMKQYTTNTIRECAPFLYVLINIRAHAHYEQGDITHSIPGCSYG